MGNNQTLIEALQQTISKYIKRMEVNLSEVTITIEASDLIEVMTSLKTNPNTSLEQCIDLCGVDYLEYPTHAANLRFAVVYHLLSLKHNWRLRVRTYAPNNDFPLVPSLSDLWNGLNWFEREAFDLYGIIFHGHPDLRRILTDYGFIGNPFRKDFPVSGTMEMIYDEQQKRVVYQKVTIEPREVIPRIIREDSYCGRN